MTRAVIVSRLMAAGFSRLEADRIARILVP
jgi:hypothetical protein